MRKKIFLHRLYGIQRRLGFNLITNAIQIPDTDEYFIPIDKNGCSSIKHVLYQAIYGSEYKGKDIHKFFKNDKKYFLTPLNKRSTVALIRNPIDRFISTLKNRIIENPVVQNDFPKDSSIIEFAVSNFEQVINFDYDLAFHLRPQNRYILPNTKLMAFDEIDLFVEKYRLPMINARNQTQSMHFETEQIEIARKFVSHHYAEDLLIYKAIKRQQIPDKQL